MRIRLTDAVATVLCFHMRSNIQQALRAAPGPLPSATDTIFRIATTRLDGSVKRMNEYIRRVHSSNVVIPVYSHQHVRDATQTHLVVLAGVQVVGHHCCGRRQRRVLL